MSTKEVHSVIFYSPGTLFSETSSRDVQSWDVRLALDLASDISERYGAKPFGFRFVTYTTADPVPDGIGGTLEVERKKTKESPMHYIDGCLMTLDDVRKEPKNDTLIFNMEANGIARVVTGPVRGKNFRWTHEFHEGDLLFDFDGKTVPT